MSRRCVFLAVKQPMLVAAELSKSADLGGSSKYSNEMFED